MKNNFITYIKSNQLFSKNDKIILAISGGIDSICLANLFLETKYNVEYAHCNFKLRGDESDKDLEFVKELASKNNIPFHSVCFETKDYSKNNQLSIQMAARELRYNWFEQLRVKIKADYIAIAHNLDDKVETFFINITRGTGLKGVTSMKKQNGFIVRPLMFAKRIEIENYILNNNLKYREDSSNKSTVYLRNKIRHELIPVLKEMNPSILETVNKEINVLDDVYTIYKNYISLKVNDLLLKEKDRILISKKKLLKLSYLNTFIYEIFNSYGFTDFDSISRAVKGEVGKQFFSSSHKLLIDREFLIIENNKMCEFEEIYLQDSTLSIEKPISISFKILKNNQSLIHDFSACFDFDKLKFPLKIRKWKNGDRFIPLGMKNFKNLSDFFIDAKLDSFSKHHTYLLCSGNDIIWVIGYRIDDRYKITSKTKKMYIANLLDQ